MKNLQTLQFLRFIAAALVVVYHCYEQLPYLTYLFPQMVSFSRVGAVGVHIFFVISGFIMVYASRNKFGKPESRKPFLTKRFLRIYPLFWGLSIAYILVYLVTNEMEGSRNLVSTLLSFSLLPGFQSLYIGPAWTLSYEVYFYIIFSIFLVFKIEKSLMMISLMFTLSILIGIFIPEKPAIVHLLTNSLLLEFSIGMFIGYLFVKGVTFQKSTCLFYLITGILLLLMGAVTSIYEKIPTLMSWGVPSGFIVFGAIFYEKVQSVGVVSKISWLGDSSYSLYLIHMLVINSVISFGIIESYASEISGEVIVLFLSICCVVLGVYTYKCIEAPLLEIARKKLVNQAV